MKTARILGLITIIVLAAYPITADAVTGLSLGARVGAAEYRGEVLPGSEDVGSDLSWGLVLGVGTLPMIDLQLRAGYFKKDFEYTYSAGGADVTIPFEYRDTSVSLFLKSNFFSPPGSPVALYAGAGMGMHWMNTEIASVTAITGQPFELLENTGKLSAEGMLGLRLSAPGMPLSVFGEASYGSIFADDQISVLDFSGGLLLSF